MTTSFWQDEKVTVVLLPSEEQSTPVLELAKVWAEVGVMGPALWVRPEDVTLQNGPPKIQAIVIGTPPEQGVIQVEVDLFEQLARDDFEIIRLVKLRTTSEESESDKKQDEIVKLIDDYLNLAMPALDRRQNHLESRVRLLIITLVCSTTEFKAGEVLNRKQLGEGVTIYASPEDRSSPWSTDAFVRNSNRFPGFMLMHLATVGGLWNGLPIGSLELIDSPIHTHGGVSVSRVFFSGVLTDGLARRVAAETLDYAAQFDSILEASPVGTAYIEDDKQDFYVDTLVGLFVKDDGSTLLFNRPEEFELKPAKKLGIISQLKLFAVFAGQRFVQIPKWSFRYFKTKLSKTVQKTFQSEQGFAELNPELLRPSLDPQDQLILDLFLKNKETVENAQITMQAPILQTQVRSTTALWKRIRDLIFGALDGGPGLLESGFERVGDGGLSPVFQNVKTLFIHPDEKWAFDAETELPEDIPREITWQNVTEIRRAQGRLVDWISELRGGVKQTNEEISVKRIDFSADSDLLELTEERLREVGAFVEDDKGTEKLLTIGQAKRIFTIRAQSEIIESVEPVDDNAETELSEQDLNDESLTEESGETKGNSNDYPEEEDQVEWEPEQSATQSISNPVSEFDEYDGLVNSIGLEELLADIRLRRSLQKRIKQTYEEIEMLETLSLSKATTLSAAEIALAEFESRLQELERTLLWKLGSRLGEQRDLAQDEADRLEKRINELDLDEPNQLVKFRQQFHRGLMWVWGIIALIALVIVIARYIEMDNTNTNANLYRSFDDWWVYFWLITFLAFAVPYTSFAISYYRKWAKHRRKMQELELELQHLPERYINARREVQRLEVIHRQTFEWMDLLARALTKPWSVRPKWLESGLADLDTSAMPFAMRVAHANDDDQASKAIFKTKAAKKLVTPGWRRKAFERLVDQIAQVHGRTPETFSIEALDKDLPHASNGARKLLRNSLDDVETLEHVALSFLRPVISDLQSNAMAVAKPTVLQVDDNPLNILRTDLEGIEDGIKEAKWEDFLLHTLTREDGRPDPITPISALAMSKIAVTTGSHENVSSFALMSKHVEKRIGGPDGLTNVKVKAYEPERVRPLDAVVRVDLIGPVKSSELRLWDSAKSTEPSFTRASIESDGQYEEL